MAVKTIVTIDFDYIMFPCIKLYNDMCGGDANPTECWMRIEAERKISNHISYDAKALYSIAAIMKTILSRNKDCKFITVNEHQELIKEVVDKETDEDIEYDVVNIDFHHDVYYRPDDPINMSYFTDYNCSNWLGYIFYTDRLNSYTWISAPNSDPLDKNVFEDELRDKITIKSSFGLKDYIKEVSDPEYKVDYLVFCLSPQWVPYRYHHIFNLLSYLLNEGR